MLPDLAGDRPELAPRLALPDRALPLLGDAARLGPGQRPPHREQGGAAVTVSRTGYSGDLGYEVWIDEPDALHVWDTMWDSMDGHGVLPFGLAALHSGWTEGMQLVGKGGMIELEIPPELGYGKDGFPPDIPPGATLHFIVELLDVK